MGSYAKVRGWFEVVDDAAIPLILDVINEIPLMASKQNINPDSVSLYQNGWHVGERINDTQYVFFGADIRAYYVDFYKGIFKKISQLKVHENFSDADFTPYGIFYIDYYGGSERGSNVWKISNATLVEYPQTPCIPR